MRTACGLALLSTATQYKAGDSGCASLHHYTHIYSNTNSYLVLDLGPPKGQQECLAVLCPQSIDATCINGPHQVFIHLILWILLIQTFHQPHPAQHSTVIHWLIVILTA